MGRGLLPPYRLDYLRPHPRRLPGSLPADRPRRPRRRRRPALDTRGNQGVRRKGFDPRKRGGETGGGFPIWTIPAALAGLILIALAAFGTITAVRRRYNRLAPAERADAHLRELPTALARLGWPLAPAETLLALERRLYSYRKDAAVRLVAKPARVALPDRRRHPDLADCRAMRDDFAGGDGLRSRLRALLALPPGGPTGSV